MLFLELSDRFVELPAPRDAVIVFPRGVPWFMYSPDTEPLVYLAGSLALIETIARTCPRQFVRVTLDDEI